MSHTSSGSLITFDDWREQNKEIADFLEFFSFGQNQSQIKVFMNKRIRMHRRLTEDLSSFLGSIDKKIKEIRKLLDTEESVEIPKPTGFIFDKQTDNDKLRIQTFLRVSVKERKVQYLKDHISHCCNKKVYVNNIRSILFSNMLPQSIILNVTPSFFDLDLKNQYNIEILRMQVKIKSYFHDIVNIPNPSWISSFSAFFMNLVSIALSKINTELFYFESFPEEILFSRSIFYGNRRISHPIDDFIARCAKGSFIDFGDRIIEFCSALLKDFCFRNPQEQSIGLLLYYRLIMDRTYEIYSHVFIPSEYNNYSFLDKIRIKQVTLPKDLNGFAESDEYVRASFLREDSFRKASGLLEMAYLFYNPVDSLYQIHCAMGYIHRGSISKSLGREPSQDDLKQILGFDDLFSMFFCVLISSDIPNIEHLHYVVSLFAPRTCLSPMFEYAKANLEALVLHCKRLNKTIKIVSHDSVEFVD